MIGIGAGPAADGQVLVFHDLLGIYDGHAARFVKRYANVREQMIEGVSAFAEDVRARRYPEPEHGYTMAPDEIERLHALLGETPASRSPAASRSEPRERPQRASCASRPAATATSIDTRPRAWPGHGRASRASRIGVVSVFVPGLHGGGHRAGARAGRGHDLRETLERLVPREGDYEHNRLNARHQLPRPHPRPPIVGPVRDRPVRDGSPRARHLAAAGAGRLRRPAAPARVVVTCG